MTLRQFRRYVFVFVAGQVAGIIAAERHDRDEFVASVRATIDRWTR